jgi:hypothetical protein
VVNSRGNCLGSPIQVNASLPAEPGVSRTFVQHLLSTDKCDIRHGSVGDSRTPRSTPGPQHSRGTAAAEAASRTAQ